MKQDKRNFIIISKHKRWQRLWQFFFTGWGLIMVAALVAGALFTKQLLWSPVSGINMADVVSNQFKMTNALFMGTDVHGEPFKIHAKTGRQEYNRPDIILLESLSGYATQIKNNQKNTYNFSANRGEYNLKTKTVTLYGNVKIKTSDNKELHSNELVVRL